MFPSEPGDRRAAFSLFSLRSNRTADGDWGQEGEQEDTAHGPTQQDKVDKSKPSGTTVRRLVKRHPHSKQENTSTTTTKQSSPEASSTEKTVESDSPFSPRVADSEAQATLSKLNSPSRVYLSETSQGGMSSSVVEMHRLSEDNPASIADQEASAKSSLWSRGVAFFLRPCFPHYRRRASTLASIQRNRVVLITGGHRFVENVITTAKYNFFTFMPKFLFEQFRKYSNLFFLFIALMQQIPNVSPTGRFTTAVPLAFILFVSASKEIFEDLKRHRADKSVNSTEVYVFNRFGRNFVKKKWKNVTVGDIVLVDQDNFFPGDLVLLSSHEPNGLCYIETSNLDGETNLKARSALRSTDSLCSSTNGHAKDVDLDKICSSPLLTGVIECDAPNKQLYEFTGKLRLEAEEYPITPDNILLRGAKMRNTQWALGCVIYTGHETKLMMNSLAQAPLKQSLVEVSTNRQIIALLAILMIICLISTVCSLFWIENNGNHWYISDMKSQVPTNFFLIMLTFFILYNNLIPISLQVTLEVVRFVQAHFINCDLEMYCEETDTPAMARTSNLNEELGQVRYILSDKTGTLTRNVMEFKKCSISGQIYDERRFYRLIEMIRKKEEGCDQIREFLTLLAVCHTVIPEPSKHPDNGGRYTYQASSPDEAALVKGAQKIGFEFLQRSPNAAVIDAMGSKEKYEILNVLEFNSDRKRMSVIVRTPQNKLKLYTKGADSIIQKRLTQANLAEFGAIETNLITFATDGLRTLCCAYREIDEHYYKDWEERYKKAMLQLDSGKNKTREKAIADCMSEIESELILLGATGIEDKLQEGVPDTIEMLMKAGISIWMLTGDKQETATNIAYSCRLLKDVQTIESYHIVDEDTFDGTREAINAAEVKLKENPLDFTLIIDTKSISFALQPELRNEFMNVGLQCRSVVCCRVSPAQKAEIVGAVKNATNAITLAIGDGANDVAMIRAANVGVGISGREGLQAVYSSDYSIAQFRFLSRLLLVHGSWSLSRVSKLTLYSFYKNIALYIIELWFATISAWSGMAVFERWTIGLYNVIFTAGPPLAIGLFDRTCSSDVMMANPELYQDSSKEFSIKLFWIWIAASIWHSLVLFWLTYFMVVHDTLWANGKADGGYLCFGNILYTYVVITVCLKAALETNCWTFMTHILIWGSIASWFAFLVIYCRLWPTFPIAADIASIDRIIFSSSLFWLGIAIIPFVALLIDIIYKLVSRTCFKSLADQITELELAKTAENQQSFTERARLLVRSFLPGGQRTRTVGMGGGGTAATADDQLAREPNASRVTPRSSAAKSRPPTTDSEKDALHGYSFSQEEGNVGNEFSQGKVIRMYNTEM